VATARVPPRDRTSESAVPRSSSMDGGRTVSRRTCRNGSFGARGRHPPAERLAPSQAVCASSLGRIARRRSQCPSCGLVSTPSPEAPSSLGFGCSLSTSVRAWVLQPSSCSSFLFPRCDQTEGVVELECGAAKLIVRGQSDAHIAGASQLAPTKAGHYAATSRHLGEVPVRRRGHRDRQASGVSAQWAQGNEAAWRR
jgi:hypothetical protein